MTRRYSPVFFGVFFLKNTRNRGVCTVAKHVVLFAGKSELSKEEIGRLVIISQCQTRDIFGWKVYTWRFGKAMENPGPKTLWDFPSQVPSAAEKSIKTDPKLFALGECAD